MRNFVWASLSGISNASLACLPCSPCLPWPCGRRPSGFALPDGTLSGFDVDLARAICDELKITCTIQARRFDTLIDALNGDQGDAIMAAIRIDAHTGVKL